MIDKLLTVAGPEALGLKPNIASTKVDELLKGTEKAFNVVSSPFFLLGFKGGVEVRELEGEMRVVNFSVPAVMVERMEGHLIKGGYYKPLSKKPLIVSDGDEMIRMTGLVPNSYALRSLGDSLSEDLLFSREGAKILSVNGALGMIGEDWLDDWQNEPLKEGQKRLWEGRGEVEKSMDSNRLGPCSYLMVDLRMVDNNSPEMIKRVLAHIAFLEKSADFVVNFDGFGNLVILALNERSVGILTQWSSTLEKIIDKPLHCFIGKGEIQRGGNQYLKVKGYLTEPYNRGWRSLAEEKPGVYSLDAHLEQIKGGRDETAVEITNVEVAGMFKRLELDRRNVLKTGRGPDRLIGYEGELQALQEALEPDNECRLILVEGQAGTGKSRLIDEAIDKRDQKLVISMDPAGRNIPGFGLVNLLDQVANFVKRTQEIGQSAEGITKYLATYLQEFSAKDEDEKLQEVNGFGRVAATMCANALLQIAEMMPQLIIVIDDVHHIDRHSDGQIMGIISQFVEEQTGQAKVMMARRPEERYASLEQENLLRKTEQKCSVSLHNIDGSPKLDFSNAELAREYATYSLPEWLRVNSSDNSIKMLGDWAETLGQSATTPFEMSSFIHSLLDDIDGNFLVQKDLLELTEQGYERISTIKGADLLVYHLERMREQLSPVELEVLQAIAMLGQKMAMEEQLLAMLENCLGMTEFEAQLAIEALVTKNYLVAEEEEMIGLPDDQQVRAYRIWHENIRDIALNSSLDLAGKAVLAEKLLQGIDSLNNISNLQYFEILNFAALNKPITDENFWKEYAFTASRGLASSKRTEQYNQGFAYSNAALDGLGKADNPKEAVLLAIDMLKKGEHVSDSFKKLITEALVGLADNGYFLGKFADVYQAIELMEALNQPAAIMQHLYRTGFNAAMAQNNKKLLAHYYEKINLDTLTEEEELVIRLKVAYRNADQATCLAILAEIDNRPDASPAMQRMALRVETQQIIRNTQADGIDGDIVLAGRDLRPADRDKAALLITKLAGIRSKLNEDGGKFLPPIDELQMLDLEGELSALNGDYQTASRAFKEYWRIAMQMEVYPEALRAAKQQGDIEVISTLAEKTDRTMPRTGIDLAGASPVMLNHRRILKGAIEIYSEEGIFIAEKTKQNFWKFLISVQRLKAICLFLDSLDAAEFTFEKEEALRYAVIAAQDIRFLDSKPWTDYVPADLSAIDDFETCYYITPLFKAFEQFCERNHIKSPIGTNGFGSDLALAGSLKYMEQKMIPDMLDEYIRKAWPLKQAQKKTQD